MAKNGEYLGWNGGWVEVIKGRNVPLGTVGQVFWRGMGRYGPRIGIRTTAGTTFWLSESNVKPVDAPADAPQKPEAVVRDMTPVVTTDGTKIVVPGYGTIDKSPDARVVLFRGKVVWKESDVTAPEGQKAEAEAVA